MALNLLIIDTETTGLDPKQDRVIELAAILYSVDYRTTLHQVSTLLTAPAENPQERVNRIPANVLPNLSKIIQTHSLQIFMEMVNESNFAVAHNADFDRQWFDGNHLPVLQKDVKPMHWLCTMTDFMLID
jgi:DNA polymerase-3 subunit epsilon